MSAAVIAVPILVMLVFAAPSETSQACMSRNAARQTFSSVHIYWHGEGHCRDAIPTREQHQIDIVRAAPPSIIERKHEPTVTPLGVMLAAIAVVLMLGTIEVLFRCTIRERPEPLSRRDAVNADQRCSSKSSKDRPNADSASSR
jgi:hypothetical protein